MSTAAAATPAAALDGELVRAALASSGTERPVERLAAALALPSEQFVRLAAEYFELEPLTMAQLRASTADFGLVSFVEATQRLCATLTAADGRKLVVLTDPLDARTRAWAAQRLRARRVEAR